MTVFLNSFHPSLVENCSSFSFSGTPDKFPRPLEIWFHPHDFCDIINVGWAHLAYIHDFQVNPFILANHRAENIEKIFPEEKGRYIFIF